MPNFKTILLSVAIVFVIIQFIQPDRTMVKNAEQKDINQVINMPDTIAAMLKQSCYNCHSNNTTYPWYTYVQPIGWYLSYHVQNGRQQLDLSEFDKYSIRKQATKIKEMASQVKEKEMPMSSYLWMHKEARLSDDQRMLLVTWLEHTADSLRTKF